MPGVAEPGGQGGHGPPKNLSGWAKVCFGPPKILTTGPPLNGLPVVKIVAKSLLSTLKYAKNFRLRRANMDKTHSSGDFMNLENFLILENFLPYYSRFNKKIPIYVKTHCQIASVHFKHKILKIFACGGLYKLPQILPNRKYLS